MHMINIRNERESDYKTVEDIIRGAFYNIYVPGCAEHYLAHIMRGHKDFVPELDFVIELDGEIIGNIMYTESTLTAEDGSVKTALTFGPVCISPEHQRKGFGKQLMEYSFDKARKMGYDVIVIFGSPANYVSSGFKSCKKFGVCLEDGSFPSAMLVKELTPGALGGKLIYRESPVMQLDEEAARRFDEALPPMEKKHLPSQEEFYIMSRSSLK